MLDDVEAWRGEVLFFFCSGRGERRLATLHCGYSYNRELDLDLTRPLGRGGRRARHPDTIPYLQTEGVPYSARTRSNGIYIRRCDSGRKRDRRGCETPDGPGGLIR